MDNMYIDTAEDIIIDDEAKDMEEIENAVNDEEIISDAGS